jgi:hypothetical protein
MCELLVRTIDKISEDPYKDVQLTKKGDVIAIQEDGWVWSVAEKTNPEWKIIKFTGVVASKLSGFLIEETGNKKTDRMLQRRHFKFKLDEFNSSNLDSLQESEIEMYKTPTIKKQDPNVLSTEDNNIFK